MSKEGNFRVTVVGAGVLGAAPGRSAGLARGRDCPCVQLVRFLSSLPGYTIFVTPNTAWHHVHVCLLALCPSPPLERFEYLLALEQGVLHGVPTNFLWMKPGG